MKPFEYALEGWCLDFGFFDHAGGRLYRFDRYYLFGKLWTPVVLVKARKRNARH